MTDIHEHTRTQLELARGAEHGRSATLVLHDGVLRQTIIALREGAELAEHNAPAAASVQVLEGRIRVTSSTDAELAAGELYAIPPERHGVVALADAVFLLTTVTGLPGAT